MHHTKYQQNIAIFVALNAMIQFIADVIIEFNKIFHFRINHLSLTFLNAFISFKTLSAILKDKFRFLHEDVQIMFLLEILLILGDIYYLIDEGWDKTFFFVRLSFVTLSLFNALFSSYIIYIYELYHLTYQGTTCRDNDSTTIDI